MHKTGNNISMMSPIITRNTTLLKNDEWTIITDRLLAKKSKI